MRINKWSKNAMTCHKSDFMHKHHIIPRYMGGSNSKDNLVEVTVTQHAMFHFCNYQLWGNEEDRLAWIGLSGIVPKEELVHELMKLGQRKAIELAKTPENIEKKKKKFKEIGHQQGEKNSQHGTVWIYNKELRECTRIPKGDPIPEGWHKGRIMDFGEYERKFKEEEIRKEEMRIRKKEREIKKQEKIKLYEMYYNLYLNYGFKYIKENFNYDKTQESLIMSFKRYVKDYVPFKILEFRHKHPKTP
jgi:hypothetical protein